MQDSAGSRPRTQINTYRIIQAIIGIAFIAFLIWRLYEVLIIKATYGPDTWLRFFITGIIMLLVTPWFMASCS
jgi:succinate dehydrogenase hydrophobic anchor subunit